MNVLVVQRDEETAEQLAQWLQADGHTVLTCAGPQPGRSCLVLSRGACDACERADVAVYDPWVAGEPGTAEIVAAVRRRYPRLALILTGGQSLSQVLSALVQQDPMVRALSQPITRSKVAQEIRTLA